MNFNKVKLSLVIVAVFVSIDINANTELNVELMEQVEQLQEEVQSLRGMLEEQCYEIKSINKRQEQLFSDLDKKIISMPNLTNTKNMTKNNGHYEGEVSLGEKDKYEISYNLMKKNKYKDAKSSFQDFLRQYPNGDYISNVYYWLGEIYFIEWEQDRKNQTYLDRSIEYFSIIISKYKNHDKYVDSLLKLGLIEIEKQNFRKAREYFGIVQSQSPKSSGANFARAQLQRLEREGKL